MKTFKRNYDQEIIDHKNKIFYLNGYLEKYIKSDDFIKVEETKYIISVTEKNIKDLQKIVADKKQLENDTLQKYDAKIFAIIENLRSQLNLQKTNFFKIGEHMVQLQLEFTTGFIVINDETYFATEPMKLLCEVFDMKKSNVYNYINLYANFSDQEEYKDYSLSQLVELLPLSKSDLNQIKISPTLSVKKIREIVQAFKNVELPDQTNISDHEVEEEENLPIDENSNDSDQVLTYEKVVSDHISSHLNFIHVNIVDKEQQILLHPKNMKLRGHLEQMQLDFDRTEKLKENLLISLKRYIN